MQRALLGCSCCMQCIHTLVRQPLCATDFRSSAVRAMPAAVQAIEAVAQAHLGRWLHTYMDCAMCCRALLTTACMAARWSPSSAWWLSISSGLGTTISGLPACSVSKMLPEPGATSAAAAAGAAGAAHNEGTCSRASGNSASANTGRLRA